MPEAAHDARSSSDGDDRFDTEGAARQDRRRMRLIFLSPEGKRSAFFFFFRRIRIESGPLYMSILFHFHEGTEQRAKLAQKADYIRALG